MNKVVSYQTCNGQQFKALVQAATSWLENNHKRVNDLNVFPVPDGDTGTNMMLTMKNALKEILGLDTDHVGQIVSKVAYGAVMGSRGNSGTILSQIWSGLADIVREEHVLDSPLLIRGLRRATDKAYKGVQHPVEGTILTVIREITEAVEALPNHAIPLDELLKIIVDVGWKSVQNTPELLPTLKQAKVVDSGGTGLMYILEGMLRYMNRESVAVEATNTFEAAIEALHTDNGVVEHPGENFYDVQFIIKGQRLDAEIIKADIERMGESAVVVATDTVVKVHVHVANPAEPIGYAIQHGQITDVVIENMLEQYEAFVAQHELATKSEPAATNLIQPGDIAVIAVVPSTGFGDMFYDLQVTALVNGGQTNNPSVEEFIRAFESINTDKIILLPNNKNIILTAKQAAEMMPDREIMVIPTRTVPQGISAMYPYQPKGDLHQIAQAMTAAKDSVVTAEITTAVRSVELDNVKVEEGQVIGLLDGQLTTVGDNELEVAKSLLAQADLEDRELLTVYFGADVSHDQAAEFAEKLVEAYPNLEVEIAEGGQPHYPYILSIE